MSACIVRQPWQRKMNDFFSVLGIEVPEEMIPAEPKKVEKKVEKKPEPKAKKKRLDRR